MSSNVPKPAMSIAERRRRMFVGPGPGSYDHVGGLAKRSVPFTKAGRDMTFTNGKPVSPGPKYAPDTLSLKKKSPNCRMGKSSRFENVRPSTAIVSYLDSKTKCMERPSNKFSKTKRFMKLKSQKDVSPGPSYFPNVDHVKRNDRTGSSWGTIKEKRFMGTYKKAIVKKHSYISIDAMPVDKRRSPKAAFSKAKRDGMSPKSITPAPKYMPDVSKDSRKKSSASAGWGHQTMPRFF